MYDSLNLRLTSDILQGTSFLEEVPQYLTEYNEHIYNDGSLYLSGNIGNLSVSISEHHIRVSNSLCKWYLGDNMQSMGRKDTQRAIEALSDTLHLPFDKAIVSRMDIAQNFVVNYPPNVYINHLGDMQYKTRLVNDGSLYYKSSNGCLCFYDKIKEQKDTHEHIPQLFQGCNVLRYEQRIRKGIAKHFGVQCVNGSMLYDEKFYMAVLNDWQGAYKSIKKINDIIINFEVMRTKRDFDNVARLCFIEKMGGQMAMLAQFKEAQSKGELTKKQAFDLRKAVNDACEERQNFTKKSDAIEELDRKVSNAIMFYR